MEGPQFSTKAESNAYRAMGMDLIGMTNLQEAKLAREAEICYTTIALVTDYDCWHPDHDAVTVGQIIENLQKNSLNAQQIIRAALKRLPVERTCKCGSALQHAVLTDLKKAPEGARLKLEILLQKYL
jgi:5'-methylthioadenosine phosphorylase